MWYSVLKQELTLQENFAGTTYKVPAGTVWAVKKGLVDGIMGVVATHIDDAYKYGPLYFFVDEARSLMTKPTKDLNSAIEESFMVSESVYC